MLDCDLCCDEEDYLCANPDAPLFHWCNVCHRDDWELTATNSITSIYNACECNPGQSFQFQGSTQIVATGPLEYITSIIICGHNITDGSVSTFPVSSDDNVTGIGLHSQGPCLDAITKPVILSLTGLPDEGVGQVTIDLTSNTDDIICINELFIGRKFFLPDDMLPSDYEYIHDGCDYESEVKNSECGQVLSRTLKQSPVDMSLTIDCLSHEWIKENWRPLIAYMKRYGVLFQPSRNNCPDDLFKGWIEGTVGGSTYNDDCSNSVTLNAKGFISQPQVVKKFVTE